MEFSSTQAAKAAGIHPQTAIKWSGEGLVNPKKGHVEYHPRRYSVQDVVALMVAKAALEFGFDRKHVKEMVKLAQGANLARQKKAAIVALQGDSPGFIRQAWYSNVKDPKQAKELAQLTKEKRVINTARFDEIIKGMLGKVQETQVFKALAEAEGGVD
jgi:DNA-binding transcriptional MerR regulator